MTCPTCNGLGIVETTRAVPSIVYGEPVTLQVSGRCPKCAGTGKLKPKFNGKLERVQEQDQ